MLTIFVSCDKPESIKYKIKQEVESIEKYFGVKITDLKISKDFTGKYYAYLSVNDEIRTKVIVKDKHEVVDLRNAVFHDYSMLIYEQFLCDCITNTISNVYELELTSLSPWLYPYSKKPPLTLAYINQSVKSMGVAIEASNAILSLKEVVDTVKSCTPGKDWNPLMVYYKSNEEYHRSDVKF